MGVLNHVLLLHQRLLLTHSYNVEAFIYLFLNLTYTKVVFSPIPPTQPIKLTSLWTGIGCHLFAYGILLYLFLTTNYLLLFEVYIISNEMQFSWLFESLFDHWPMSNHGSFIFVLQILV